MEEFSSKTVTTGLRCRSCRAVIFDDKNIFTEHSTEKRPTIKSKFTTSSCSHYFLDGDAILAAVGLSWLETQTQTGNQEGPVNCWKCSHKLGSFNWKGHQCACGAWQIPAIGIIKSKVDPIVKRIEE